MSITETMKIRKPTPSASALAERHANAVQKYNAERASIIDEGTKRIEDLTKLRKEIEAEESEHRAVLSSVGAAK